MKRVLSVIAGAAACVALAQGPANAVGSYQFAYASNGRGYGAFNATDGNKFKVADTKADGYSMVLRIKFPGRAEITSCDDRNGANNGVEYCTISNIPHNTTFEFKACAKDFSGGLPGWIDCSGWIKDVTK
ncbi:hypothetical protein ACGFMM_15580 [Streptomyces sp. NPDC048604]|uniref:hypothetical protein n=1 Tax=Streptomyces sp. NPDC048604 TaxID=3365578 RepID=UPI003717BD5B